MLPTMTREEAWQEVLSLEHDMNVLGAEMARKRHRLHWLMYRIREDDKHPIGD